MRKRTRPKCPKPRLKTNLDTACCGVPISAVLTGANVHDSRVAMPLMRISAQRVNARYELMDAAYCSMAIREEIRSAGRVPLIDHNPTTRARGRSKSLRRMKPSATKPDQVQSVATRGSRTNSQPVMCRYAVTPR